MDVSEWMIGGLALLGAAGCVALLLGRGKLLARCAAAEEGTRRAEAGCARAEARSGAAEKHGADLGSRVEELRLGLARAEEEKRSLEAVHAQVLEGKDAELRIKLTEVARREEEFRRHVEQLEGQMKGAFAALAGETLSRSTAEFLKLAQEKLGAAQQASAADLESRRTAIDQLVKPLGETLKRADEKLASIEKQWMGDRAQLTEQIRHLGDAGRALRDETDKLVRALREPHVRGRYGELQLKRVAELAGMTGYCDFEEQGTARDGEGGVSRPDMVVRMPSGRSVVIDAKTNIQAYLDAHQAATPEEAAAHLDRFARHVAEQAAALSKKKYWSRVDGSPEFVVMFLPHDAFLDAALSRRPGLIEQAWSQHNVVFATPSSLIALLRAVHIGYQEQRLAKEAGELRDLAMELHERAATALSHASDLGRALGRAVANYNAFVGSYERRLEPALREFKEKGVKITKPLPEMEKVDETPRVLAGSVVEWKETGSED